MGKIGIISRLHRIVHKAVAVISAQTIPGTEPQIAASVLMDVADGIVRQSVIGRIMLEYKLKRLGLQDIEGRYHTENQDYIYLTQQSHSLQAYNL